jgi:hypothetical protein
MGSMAGARVCCRRGDRIFMGCFYQRALLCLFAVEVVRSGFSRLFFPPPSLVHACRWTRPLNQGGAGTPRSGAA